MYNTNPYFRQNILPQQQILQANGRASIDMLQMAPNSSVLIADANEPIVWKCVSDSIGNVTAQAFDITPRKSEAEVKQDYMQSIDERLTRLEAKYESIIGRTSEQPYIKGNSDGKEYPKSSRNATELGE